MTHRFYSYLKWGIGIIVCLIVAVNLIIDLNAKPFIYSDMSGVPNAEVAIVPGAAILKNNDLSPVFRDRVDMAIKLYEAKKVSKILVSGDNSSVTYNEVNPARRYLISKGVDDGDIFLDHAGFDTYSTMYRAKNIFGVTSAIIASQSFHLPRAVYIARHLGMNAYGVTADQDKSLFRNYVREVFADLKAMIDLLINRQPKYLGDKIPIMGDGSLYP